MIGNFDNYLSKTGRTASSSSTRDLLGYVDGTNYNKAVSLTRDNLTRNKNKEEDDFER